ncbi:unnamed protein product, partial [Prorocentrum cordatum]
QLLNAAAVASKSSTKDGLLDKFGSSFGGQLTDAAAMVGKGFTEGGPTCKLEADVGDVGGDDGKLRENAAGNSRRIAASSACEGPASADPRLPPRPCGEVAARGEASEEAEGRARTEPVQPLPRHFRAAGSLRGLRRRGRRLRGGLRTLSRRAMSMAPWT